jgi:hypothetical protein
MFGENTEAAPMGRDWPKLIADVIALFSLERYLFPPEAFCPLG